MERKGCSALPRGRGRVSSLRPAVPREPLVCKPQFPQFQENQGHRGPPGSLPTIFFFFFFGMRNQTQGLGLAWQVLCNPDTSPPRYKHPDNGQICTASGCAGIVSVSAQVTLLPEPPTPVKA